MTQIDTTLNVTVKEGRKEEFKRLGEEMSEAVENNEPGTKRYQFFLNDDQTQCVVNESYVNLEAALAHLKSVASQTILPKIFDACKINRFEVFGEINDDLMKALAQMGGVNYHFLTGFSRDSI
jgi:quinol monooxygenase YgiN